MSETEPGFWDGHGPRLIVGAVTVVLVLVIAIAIFVAMK
jgi:hypothetical protein